MPARKFESLCNCRLLNKTGSGVLAGEYAILCGVPWVEGLHRLDAC